MNNRKLSLMCACVAGLAVLIGFSGCVTKAQARAQAKAAFEAGQRQALQDLQRQQVSGPSVTLIGAFRTLAVPWSEDLTLAKAVVAGGYYGTSDPTEIVILRGGLATRIDLQQLLSGQDIPLNAGDVISVK